MAKEKKEQKSEPRSSLMPSSAPPTKPSAKPPEQAHDDRDVDVGLVLRVGVLIVAGTALVMALMWWGTRELEQSERAPGEPLPIAQGRSESPPEPRLQPRPTRGLEELRAKEQAALESYGWVDRDRRQARIPIERAIAITAERAAENDRPGLTWRSEAPAEPSVSRPTDSSLGAVK